MTLLDRMVLAVERVRDRLMRSAIALEQAGIPYAVAGGHAVAAWVATLDASATRNTPDIDILLRRVDFSSATRALENAGFSHQHLKGANIFLDGADGRPRDAVHIIFAGEKMWDTQVEPAPDVTESIKPGEFRIVTLEALVRMKLGAFRTKDCMHVRDMLEIGLIDASWVPRLEKTLGARLQQLIDTPETL